MLFFLLSWALENGSRLDSSYLNSLVTRWGERGGGGQIRIAGTRWPADRGFDCGMKQCNTHPTHFEL